MMEAIPAKILQLSVLALFVTKICAVYELLQSLEGSVGKENFTYYKLARTGDIRIELESTLGDVDLFVSDETNNPDFEDCKLFSVTCGIDSVDIPQTYNRPVGIGIYGHSYYELSKYIIRIYMIPPQVQELTYEQLTEKFYKYEPESVENMRLSSSSPSSESDYSDSEEEEESEGSILWQILITLLKVVFEILL